MKRSLFAAMSGKPKKERDKKGGGRIEEEKKEEHIDGEMKVEKSLTAKVIRVAWRCPAHARAGNYRKSRNSLAPVR